MLLAVMVLSVVSLLLVSSSPDVGTRGFIFLRVPPSAREAAMGNAAAGLSNDVFGLWYNPAGIAAVKNPQLGVGHVSYVAGVQSGTVAYVKPSEKLSFGFGGYYLNSGEMKLTSDNPGPNENLGTFLCSYLDVNATGGVKVTDGVGTGLSLKVLYSGIYTYWTVGLAGNIGVIYDLPVQGLRAGLVCRNLGVTVKPFAGDTQTIVRDRLPTEFALGFSYLPAPPLLLSLEILKPIENDFEGRLGVEAWLHEHACLRGGITTRGGDLKAGGGWDFAAGLSTGLGVRFRQFELDYAFTPMVILDNAHRLSFRWNL